MMTYKDIVNRFRSVAFRHEMIQDFGYGEVSDIKTQSQGSAEADGADYPYMFLNPGTHNRNRSVVTYQFNIIMMDMARGEEGDLFNNYLTIQSQCQQYLDDVIANMYYGFTDKPDVTLTNITYAPFKERFQDVLAGMTATVQIEVPISLDNCIAPFESLIPPIPEGDLVVDVITDEDMLFRPDVAQSPLVFQQTIIDTFNGMRPVLPNYYQILRDGIWTFVVEGTVRRTTANGSFPDSFDIEYRYNSGPVYSAGVGNWPTDPPLNVDVPFRIEYPVINLVANDIAWVAWLPLNDPPIEDQFIITTDTTMKGYLESEIGAEFTSDSTSTGEGGDITFTDASTGFPTEWAWTFEGGTPATSADQNPVIQYDTSGTYDVSLTASKPGSTDSITKTDYIEVLSPGGQLLFEYENSFSPTICPDVTSPAATFAYNVMISDPNSYWQSPVQIKNTLPVGSYRLVMVQDIQFGSNPPTYVIPAEPVIRKPGTGEFITADSSSGWPTSYTPGNTYTYQAEYLFDINPGDPATTADIFIQDTVLQGDRCIVQMPNGNIQLYTA